VKLVVRLENEERIVRNRSSIFGRTFAIDPIKNTATAGTFVVICLTFALARAALVIARRLSTPLLKDLSHLLPAFRSLLASIVPLENLARLLSKWSICFDPNDYSSHSQKCYCLQTLEKVTVLFSRGSFQRTVVGSQMPPSYNFDFNEILPRHVGFKFSNMALCCAVRMIWESKNRASTGKLR